MKSVMRITVTQVFLLIIFTNGAFAKEARVQQDIKTLQTIVKGTVTSSQGEVLSGVSINLKGTTIGTTTDSEGKYAINILHDGILIFTHTGYVKQEIRVGAQAIINIKLEEENAELTKVVVVGYGTQKKKILQELWQVWQVKIWKLRLLQTFSIIWRVSCRV